jgi:para-aminobenzoate synthetase component 1
MDRIRRIRKFIGTEGINRLRIADCGLKLSRFALIGERVAPRTAAGSAALPKNHPSAETAYGFHDKIGRVREIDISSDRLIENLLGLSGSGRLCILDSCGIGHLGSHLLIAGIDPVKTLKISNEDADSTLKAFEENLARGQAGIFTISYNLGLKLEKIAPRAKEFAAFPEPDIYLALFDSLLVHDYNDGKTYIAGSDGRSDEIKAILSGWKAGDSETGAGRRSPARSNFTKSEYLEAIGLIQEYIRQGDTYQTNLTQQLRVTLPPDLTPGLIFRHLRKAHPAPFAAFIERDDSTVISASPERFFKISGSTVNSRTISTSPIKGTRPRGETPEEDAFLREELLHSAKDRAENIMIVDLLRNDIGRICDFGSVRIEKLCDLEEHPTLFHLVSTVSGALREDVSVTDMIRALFPCGSITGAPKIRTMQIIDEIETADRGLSMGAIGVYIPPSWGPEFEMLDTSVAIRTMVVSAGEAVFNVGGGIVIDSDPEKEYAESLLKAKALLSALEADHPDP